MAIPPPIIVSTRDAIRLEQLLESLPATASSSLHALEEELARAELRAPQDVPADVVTMNSTVLCVDERTGVEQAVRLVYPDNADGTCGNVSILAPVGAALLGLSTGQSIAWPLPGGRVTQLRVSAVLHQPEAAGLVD